MFDWNDLRYYLAVARSGSTNAAAKALKVSQSTVHRRLEELEVSLGRHLVIRQSTGYKLTEFGSGLVVFAEQVEKATASLERFVLANDATINGPVRVTCSESIGYRLMQSALFDRFKQKHPGMTVELILGDRIFDLTKGEADVAIRAGELHDDTLVGRKIAAVQWGLYGSKSYVSRSARIDKHEDINGHAIVGLDGSLKNHAAAKWLKGVAPRARAAALSNTLPGLLMTVKSGAGIAPLPIPLASSDPDLVALLSPIPGLESNVYLLTHQDLRRMPRISAFFEFIAAELEAVKQVLSGEK